MKTLRLALALSVLLAGASCYRIYRTTFTIQPAPARAAAESTSPLSDVAGVIDPIATNLGYGRTESSATRAHWSQPGLSQRFDIDVEESPGKVVVTFQEGCSGLGWSRSEYRTMREQLKSQLSERFGESNVTIKS